MWWTVHRAVFGDEIKFVLRTKIKIKLYSGLKNSQALGKTVLGWKGNGRADKAAKVAILRKKSAHSEMDQFD